MLCLYTLPSFGLVLDVRSGILHGATGVTVGSAIYDVIFREGSCITLFGNCDEVSDFFFSDISSAHAANLSLLNQVFLDTAAGLFDSVQTLTFGCENAPNRCGVLMPVGSQQPTLPFGAGSPVGTFVASTLFNHRLDHLDTHTGVGQAVRAADTTNSAGSIGATFSVWSLNNGGTNPIPAPAPIYLLLLGMMVWGFRSYSHPK